MKFEDITIEILHELSKEVLKGYSIDLGDIEIDEDSFLRLVCIELLERYGHLEVGYREVSMLSSNVVLVLENFMLNLKLAKLLNGHIS